MYKGFERFNGARERETPASLLLPMVATTAQAPVPVREHRRRDQAKDNEKHSS